MGKSFDTGIRKISFWVRYVPDERGIEGPVYRSKRAASKEKQRGEVLVNVSGMYVDPTV